MSAILDNIRIVLVNTSHPGNIGASVRAMKLMGLSRLYLVAPKHYPHDKAVWRAVGAADLLDRALVVPTLDEAIADCGLVVGASARERRIPWPAEDARGAAAQVVKASAANQVAIVFGREDRGLTNEELRKCQFHLTIPTSEHFTSLNLAAAVQVVSYEILMASRSSQDDAGPRPRDVALATSDDLERLMKHCEEVMIAVDFYDPENPKQLLTRLRRLLLRGRLDKVEINILRGVLGATQRAVQGQDASDDSRQILD